jgi:Ni,Fe-hydrogenase I small subunit
MAGSLFEIVFDAAPPAAPALCAAFMLTIGACAAFGELESPHPRPPSANTAIEVMSPRNVMVFASEPNGA